MSIFYILFIFNKSGKYIVLISYKMYRLQKEFIIHKNLILIESIQFQILTYRILTHKFIYNLKL